MIFRFRKTQFTPEKCLHSNLPQKSARNLMTCKWDKSEIFCFDYKRSQQRNFVIPKELFWIVSCWEKPFPFLTLAYTELFGKLWIPCTCTFFLSFVFRKELSVKKVVGKCTVLGDLVATSKFEWQSFRAERWFTCHKAGRRLVTLRRIVIAHTHHHKRSNSFYSAYPNKFETWSSDSSSAIWLLWRFFPFFFLNIQNY